MAEISNYISSNIIEEIIKDKIKYLNDYNLFETNKNDLVKFMINGRWIGYIEKPTEFIDYFKDKRKKYNTSS